jgi:membrane protein required for colicin V production
MNYIDFLLLVPLIYAAWKGYKHGFIIEIFTLFAYFVGIYAAINFSDYTANKLTAEFELESVYVAPTSFALTFLVVGALVFFAGKAIEKVVKVVALSPVNKVAGLGFGLLKMGYILSIILVVVESYDERKNWFEEETKEASVLYGPVKNLGVYTVPGLKTSQIFLENALKNEADSTGMSVQEIMRARNIADSLDIDANDAKAIHEIHKKYAQD